MAMCVHQPAYDKTYRLETTLEAPAQKFSGNEFGEEKWRKSPEDSCE
jgi:hypothetical protein